MGRGVRGEGGGGRGVYSGAFPHFLHEFAHRKRRERDTFVFQLLLQLCHIQSSHLKRVVIIHVHVPHTCIYIVIMI